MANIKKLALGLLVAFLAFGFSAFKNNEPTITSNAASLPQGYLVQISDDSYIWVANLNSGECITEVTHPCHYEVSSDNTVPAEDSPYSTSEISGYSGVGNAAGGNRLFE